MRLVDTLRMQNVLTPVIPMVGELIARTPGTISLGQGIVFYGPPAGATADLPRLLADPDVHRYKPVQGIPPLIEALSAKLRADNDVILDRDRQVVVTAGGNMAFLNAILAIADVGDEIVLLGPYYFNHHMAISMVGCRPVVVPTDENYQPRLDAIAAAIGPRTRAVVTVSPNNPTGAVYPEATLRAVNELCAARGIFHIHDEAYDYFTYGDVRAFSPGAIQGSQPHTILLHSLSKAYGFASWRIGSMVIPQALFLSVKKIQDTNVICPPVVSQLAAVGALSVGRAYCRGHLATLASVRDLWLRALGELSGFVTVPRADGAFYFLLKVSTSLDAMTLVERLVREHKVAVLPGTAFGMDQGCTIRVSYGALEPATAAEGVGRLVAGLRALVT